MDVSTSVRSLWESRFSSALLVFLAPPPRHAQRSLRFCRERLKTNAFLNLQIGVPYIYDSGPGCSFFVWEGVDVTLYLIAERIIFKAFLGRHLSMIWRPKPYTRQKSPTENICISCSTGHSVNRCRPTRQCSCHRRRLLTMTFLSFGVTELLERYELAASLHRVFHKWLQWEPYERWDLNGVETVYSVLDPSGWRSRSLFRKNQI